MSESGGSTSRNMETHPSDELAVCPARRLGTRRLQRWRETPSRAPPQTALSIDHGTPRGLSDEQVDAVSRHSSWLLSCFTARFPSDSYAASIEKFSSVTFCTQVLICVCNFTNKHRAEFAG